jgi:hypothetical protein
MCAKQIQWAAQLNGVQEVSLLGTADLPYWQQRLAAEQLTPIERDGRAQLLIISAAARYMGVRFRELSFSVLATCPEMPPGQQGAYLVQAYNSSRFFAFCERALFATPYNYGDVQLSTAPPASIQLLIAGELRFYVEMRSQVGGAPRRAPAQIADSGWEGPVFLPSASGRGARPPKLFFAQVRGRTEFYPFDHELDWFSFQSPPVAPIFTALLDSHFTPTEWLIRQHASHRKSKTRPRVEFFS